MCGISSRHISTYAKRRQIVINDDGLIDVDHEINYAFLIQKGFNEIKKQNGTGKKTPAKKAVAKKTTTKKAPAKKSPAKKAKADHKPKPVPPPVVDPEIERLKQELAAMDRDKLQADTDKKRHDAEIARIRMEKLQGLLIPTDLVVSVIQLQAESLKKAYHDAAEKLIIIFSQKKKLTNTEMGDLRRELTTVINNAIDDGIDESKKGVKKIVKEYSEVRGVGEKI